MNRQASLPASPDCRKLVLMHVHLQFPEGISPMDGAGFSDPILELTRRCGDDVGYAFELASEMTEAEARQVLEAIDETEAEQRASDIVDRLRRQGHAL